MKDIKKEIRNTNESNKLRCKKCRKKLDYQGAEFTVKGLIEYYECKKCKTIVTKLIER